MLIDKYREKFFEEWYQFSSPVFFVTLSLTYIAILLLKRMFIIADIAAFEVLQSRGEMWVFDIFFGLQYLSVPFFLAWKITITSFLLWVGCFLFGYRLTYATLWRWVMFSELLWILPEILKFLWFFMFPGDPNYQDIVAYYPLSLLNLLNYENVASMYHYPLKAFNLFEPLYWFVLTIGVYYLSKKRFSTSALIVGISYVFIFFLWLIYYTLIYK